MADNIIDRQVVQTPPLKESGPFSLPPSLDVVVFQDRNLEATAGEGSSSDLEIPVTGSIIINDGNTRLQPPGGPRIVEQIVNFRPDGLQVVDVVIEANPVSNATSYEIRMTPL